MSAAQRATLAAASLGTAMLLLDVTVVYLALPAISADLQTSFEEVQWVVDAYAVVLAATLLISGVLADRLGRRRVFALGVAAFSVTSGICALASSGTMLDLARAAQGLGAAAVFSASLALLAAEFSGAARGRALGVWGAVTGFAMAVGPLVGGVIVDALSWRWIFLINLPIGLLLLVLTLRAVPESRSDARQGLDFPGAATFGLSGLLLTWGLIRGNVAGWASAEILVTLGAAAVLLMLFIVIELRARSPILPLKLFRRRAFSGTAFISFAQSVAIYPLLIFIAIHMQQGLGLSPSAAGLRLLPMTLPILIVAPFAGRLTARLALRVPLGLGLLLLAAGLLLLTTVSAQSGWTALLPGMLVGGAGIGMISPSLAAAMVSVLPEEQSGTAAGINNTFRQFGIAVGVAGLGAIFNHHLASGARPLDGIVSGLDAVSLVAAATALAGALAAWLLLGPHRSSP